MFAPATEQLRVCHIISSFRPLIGGAEKTSENLCLELARQGADVIVLTRRRPDTQPVERIDSLLVRRAGHPSRSKIGALTFALHVLWLLATRLRDYRILHVQNPDTPLLVGIVARVLLRRRLVATMHTDPQLFVQKRRWSGRLRLRLMASLVDTVTALSPTMHLQLIRQGLPPRRVRILPNGVDTRAFRPPTTTERMAARKHLSISEHEVVYLFVGRLAAVKRVDLLLAAWSSLPRRDDRLLLIVGDGPQRAELERTARELDCSRVRFEGASEDVIGYLHAADVFVLPSDREGQSIALLEAMAAQVTPVVSELPGNLALVSHGHSGFTFPPGDAASLGEQLTAASPTEVRRRMGREARRVVENNHSLERSARSQLALYSESSSVGRRPEPEKEVRH